MLCRQKFNMAMARIKNGDDPAEVAAHFNVAVNYLLQNVKKPVEPAKTIKKPRRKPKGK